MVSRPSHSSAESWALWLCTNIRWHCCICLSVCVHSHQHVPVFVCFHEYKVCVSCKRRSRCKQEGADKVSIFQTVHWRANNLPVELILGWWIMDTVEQRAEAIFIIRNLKNLWPVSFSREWYYFLDSDTVASGTCWCSCQTADWRLLRAKTLL